MSTVAYLKNTNKTPNSTKHGHFHIDIEPQTESPLVPQVSLPIAISRGG